MLTAKGPKMRQVTLWILVLISIAAIGRAELFVYIGKKGMKSTT
jgi:hypothetical protein